MKSKAVIELKTEDFEAFFEAPFAAYGPDTLYVSPLKSDLKNTLSKTKNPLFKGESDLTFFTAHSDGKLLGRITAHVHAESNEAFGTSQAYFGFFDCVDDLRAAGRLLTAAEDWARRKGATSLVGNYNLTAMQQIGVISSGFEHAPYTDLIYSPTHIHRLLEAAGYAPEFPMTTFETLLDQSYQPPEIGPKQQAILDNPDFTFAPINRRTIDERLEDARHILNASFAQNPQFLTVSREEYHFQSKDMKWIMDPRISAILHYKGAPAACIICIPDLNPLLKKIRSRFGLSFPFHFLLHRLKRKRAVLIYSGVIPELQGQGVNPLVLNRVMTAMRDAGYTHCGNTWIGDSNKASLRQKEKMLAKPTHRLHLYRKSLGAVS